MKIQHNTSIPQKYVKFIDYNYQFNIVEIYRTKEIDVYENSYRPAYFNGVKSMSWTKQYIPIPECIFVEALIDNHIQNYLIAKNTHPILFDGFYLYRKAIRGGEKSVKYLSLYKSYECVTDKNSRELGYSAIRHALAHSASFLSKPKILNKLNELFGGVNIDLDKYNHSKTFFINYWNLMIETDKQLTKILMDKTSFSERYLNQFILIN